MPERILIVAPSWVGDAILSEPLISLLREPYADPIVDVLAPPARRRLWTHARRRTGVRDPIGHGRLDWPRRKALARAIRERLHARHRAPQLLEVGADSVAGRHPAAHRLHRRSAVGAAQRRAAARHPATPRLVERFAALALPPGGLVPMPPGPVLVPDAGNRASAMQAMDLRTDRPVAILCPVC